MRNFRDLPIKRKLTLLSLLTSTLALLLACAAFTTYEILTFRSSMVNELKTLAQVISVNSISPLIFDDPETEEITLETLDYQENIISASIYRLDGSVFARYPRDTQIDIFPVEAIHEGYRVKDDQILLFQPIFLDQEQLGTVYLRADMTAMDSRLIRYAGIAVLVFFVSFLAAWILSSKLQRVSSGPILALAQTANRISAEKNYSVRAVKQNNDEVGLLIDGFNEMLAEIQDQDADLQAHRKHWKKRSSGELPS